MEIERELCSGVFGPVSHEARLKILRLLHTYGPMSYSEIMTRIGMSPAYDAGKFAYHLRTLLEQKFIEPDLQRRKYFLTDKGRIIVEFSLKLESMLRKRGLKVRTSRMAIEDFDRNKIVKALVKEAQVPVEKAEHIAKRVEDLLHTIRIQYVSAPLIREIVNSILIEEGLEEYRHKLTRLGMPVYDVSESLRKMGEFGSNIGAFPEIAGGSILEEYTILAVLSRSVGDAHLRGSIHICDAQDWPLRPSEFQHDVRPFLRFGLKTEAFSVGPPASFRAALSLISQLLRISSFEVGNGVGVPSLNVFLAPFLGSLRREEVLEDLVLFAFELNYQHPVGRHVTIGLDPTVPTYLREEEAIGPGGSPMGCYGDFEEQARLLFDCFLDAMGRDFAQRPIINPSLLITLGSEVIEDRELEPLLLKAHQLAIEQGTPYFANRTPPWQVKAVYFSSGTRLSPDWTKDWELDTFRTGSLGHVIINLPRIAYEARGRDERFFEGLENCTKWAEQALKAKYRMVEKRVRQGNLPILSRQILNEPYFRYSNSTRVIAIVGLYEAVKAHTGSFIHEDRSAERFALRVLTFLKDFARDSSRRPDLRIVVSQAYDEEAPKRLAQLDVERFGRATVIAQGSREAPYYSATPITPREAEVDLKTRLEIESSFHRLLAGGHLATVPALHLENPSDALELTKQICQTCIGLFAYDLCLSYCDNCRRLFREIVAKCPACKSSAIVYYDRPASWYRARKSRLPAA